jgi:biotin synthase-related radical SAM superfamily protein
MTAEPQRLHPDSGACPTCQRPYPLVDTYRPLTDRELDALSAWWHYRSVQLAAKLIGVGEQRAKNLLASVRAKSGASTNLEAATLQLGQLRSVLNLASHNVQREEG